MADEIQTLLSISTIIVLVPSIIVSHLDYCKNLLSGLFAVFLSHALTTLPAVNSFNINSARKNRDKPLLEDVMKTSMSLLVSLPLTLPLLLLPPTRRWASVALVALNYHKFFNMLYTLKCLSGWNNLIWKSPTHASKLSPNYISSVKTSRTIWIKREPHLFLCFVFS